MKTLLQNTLPSVAIPQTKRSLEKLLAPLDQLAETVPNFLSKSVGQFQVGGQNYSLPHYVFLGPKSGDEPIRIGLFAGIHGDEPEGVQALVQFLKLLSARPERAAGYCLFVYPVTNPTGFEDNTRHSRRGHDLNREFWRNSDEPEVLILEKELATHAFQGIISLHTDDSSHGLYGFARGATLTEHLLKPALQAAEQLLPRNENPTIDGFHSREGIIRQGYSGILSAPPKTKPQPFEIILETPQAAPEYLKEGALLLGVQAILNEYRKFIAYAANL